MNVKIRNKFIEIKYSVSYGLVIFITNYRWFRILEISWYRRSNESVLQGLTPQMKITHCLIIYKSKTKYPGHTSGNTAAFHPVI